LEKKQEILKPFKYSYLLIFPSIFFNLSHQVAFLSIDLPSTNK